MTEIWKDIEGYEGCYQVSNLGFIKSLERVIITKQGLKKRHKERILKNTLFGTGYLCVPLTKNGTRKNYQVHRLVAQAFIPNPENKRTVNHKDSDKTNNCVENLEWHTHKENVNHSWKTGTSQPHSKNIGENCGTSKLTEDRVFLIKWLLEHSDLEQKNIAYIFDISTTTISNIKNNIVWKHIIIEPALFLNENLTHRDGWNCEAELLFKWNGEKDEEKIKEYFRIHSEEMLSNSSLVDPIVFNNCIGIFYLDGISVEVVVEISGVWSV